MNSIGTKQLLLLAAAALATAACDPFPNTDPSAPSVARVVVDGGNPTEIPAADIADPTAVVVDEVTYDATFYVWFTAQLDGTTVQAHPDVDPATGAPNTDPCDWNGSPLATKVGLFDYADDRGDADPANDYASTSSICYSPGSALDGGMIQVRPPEILDPRDPDYDPAGTGEAPGTSTAALSHLWPAGSYRIGGTVRNSAGQTTFDVTFNVTHKPVLSTPDPYSVVVGFANSTDPAVTGFDVEWSPTNADDDAPSGVWGNWKANIPWVHPTLTGVGGVTRVTGLSPATVYWVRIVPVGTATPEPSSPTRIKTGAAPSIKVTANPTSAADPAGAPGKVLINFARIRGAQYRIERAPFVEDAATAVWTAPPAATFPAPPDTPTPGISYIAVAADGSTSEVGANPIPANTQTVMQVYDSGLAIGQYLYRVVPVFAGVDGAPTKPATANVTK